jgi:hypothetical protein
MSGFVMASEKRTLKMTLKGTTERRCNCVEGFFWNRETAEHQRTGIRHFRSSKKIT